MSPRRTLVLGAAAAATVALAGLTAPAATAAPTTLTVTNPAPIAPPDGVAAGVTSTVAVSGQTGLVTDLDVTLTGITSTYPADLDIALVGPNGAVVMLTSDACAGDDVTNVTWRFDDEATGPLPANTCMSGSFWPFNVDTPDTGFITPTRAALAAFDGISPNGTWSLITADDSATDNATISGGFSLTFQVSDRVGPVTTITSAPKSGPKNKAKVAFTSNEPGATSECMLDDQGWKPCTSPYSVKKLSPGKHTVSVRSTDADKNVGAPVTASWKVKPKRR